MIFQTFSNFILHVSEKKKLISLFIYIVLKSIVSDLFKILVVPIISNYHYIYHNFHKLHFMKVFKEE